MSLLASIVSTWKHVAQTSSRTAKIRELAACLRALAAEEIEIGALYLAGEMRQGKIGVGYAVLRDASAGESASAATLTVSEVDERLAQVASTRGSGSSARRTQLLRELFVRATLDEREFLIRLMVGELRQ